VTHTALTADEEIRRIRGLATARNESRMVGDQHHESPTRRGPEQDPTWWDVLTFVRMWPIRVMQAQARLSTLIHRLGRRPANANTGPAFIAIGSSVGKKAQSQSAKCSELVSPQRPG
jgi:hypothetical protein